MVNFKNDLLQEMKNEMVQLKNELSDTNKLFIKSYIYLKWLLIKTIINIYYLTNHLIKTKYFNIPNEITVEVEKVILSPPCIYFLIYL